MINPSSITNLTRTPAQLEEFLLFCIVAAGKNADQQARKLHEFLGTMGEFAPFHFIRKLDRTPGALVAHLQRCRLGKYRDTSRAFREVARLAGNLRLVSWTHLASLHGIGIKTAKFFVLHSQGGMHAVLDTHVLEWLRRNLPKGGQVPKVSPNNPHTYLFWETVFFGLHARCASPEAGVPLNQWADVDLQIWKEMRAAA